MTESDSSTPQKVAALASAIKAVCQSIGFGSELDLLVYSCLPPTDPSAVPRDGSLEDARKEVLAAAAKFVEAVDTAERLLNAIPNEELEPLSRYTDGVRWDIATRRTLKEIQAIIFVLRNPSTDLDHLFSKRGVFGVARFEEMQSKLKKFRDELDKRAFELKCLPDELNDMKDVLHSEWNGDVNGASDANTKVSNSTNHAETDKQELEEMERNTPALNTGSIKWIAARKKNQEKLGYPTTTLATYRLESSGGKQLSEYFGVDKHGRRWRRRPDKTQTSTVYYFADDIEKYKSKVSN